MLLKVSLGSSSLVFLSAFISFSCVVSQAVQSSHGEA